jgi:cellulose synthase/poly-beta-1,6-N-acetylglucosamine synthase-like glycosyltransferase
VQQTNTLPQVSIIIPVYNGAHIIGRLLDSVQQLDYPADRYEVLVVDNNSTDDLERAVAAYPVKLLQERDIQSSYAARNLGIRQARGEILAFTDADCLVHPQWLRCLQAAFRDSTVGGAAGDIQGVDPPRSWVEEVLNRHRHMSSIDQRHSSKGTEQKLKLSFKRPSRRLPRLLTRLRLVTYWYDPRLPSLPIAPTSNVAYRREVFEEVGCFDDALFSGGDTEFAIRMQQQSNWQLVAIAQAIVYHRHRASLRQLWRAYTRYGIGYVTLIERFIGLDTSVQRQLVIKSLANLTIGIPWSSIKFIFRGLRSLLMNPPHPLYVRDLIIDLIASMSTNLAHIKACQRLRQGRGGELWLP